MLYFLDLLGTLAFAVGGAYKAKSRDLNIFGVILMGIVTAVGGGTIRDLIIGRTPLFYLQDPMYLSIIIVGSTVTYFLPRVIDKTYSIFRLTDSIGIAIFAIIGVSISYESLFHLDNALLNGLVCVLLGTITAVGGGIIRDSIMGDIPYALKSGSNYVSSAFIGSVIYLIFINTPNQFVGVTLSISTTLILREVVSPYGFYKKIILKHKGKIKLYRKSRFPKK